MWPRRRRRERDDDLSAPPAVARGGAPPPTPLSERLAKNAPAWLAVAVLVVVMVRVNDYGSDAMGSLEEELGAGGVSREPSGAPWALTDALVYDGAIPPGVWSAAAPVLRDFARCGNACEGAEGDDELPAALGAALDEALRSDSGEPPPCAYDFDLEPSNLAEQLIAKYLRPALGADREPRLVAAEYRWDRRRAGDGRRWRFETNAASDPAANLNRSAPQIASVLYLAGGLAGSPTMLMPVARRANDAESGCGASEYLRGSRARKPELGGLGVVASERHGVGPLMAAPEDYADAARRPKGRRKGCEAKALAALEIGEPPERCRVASRRDPAMTTLYSNPAPGRVLAFPGDWAHAVRPAREEDAERAAEAEAEADLRAPRATARERLTMSVNYRSSRADGANVIANGESRGARLMSDVEESAKLERVLHRFCGPRAWPESAFEALEREGGNPKEAAAVEELWPSRLVKRDISYARGSEAREARAAVRMVLDADRGGAVGVCDFVGSGESDAAFAAEDRRRA